MKRYAKDSDEDTVLYARFDTSSDTNAIDVDLAEWPLGVLSDESLQWLSLTPDLIVGTHDLDCRIDEETTLDDVDSYRPGLVLSEQVWTAAGRPSDFVPFTVGYRWIPFGDTPPYAA